MKAIFSVLLAGIMSTGLAAQIQNLNSYPSASATIFLDFDGAYVQGTAWNWYGPINAQPSGLSNTAITEIFNRVAEDYRIFNINVTTDSTVYAAAPIFSRTHIIITPTYQWYGAAGGVAYVGSFGWGDDTPAWVFSNLLSNNSKNVAEAISHESGHTLGLQHQSIYDTFCNKIAEYSGGQGTGEIGWAPIMGVGYYKNITTWYNGPNSYGCNYIQKDIDIIAGEVGFHNDDYGNTHLTATPLTVTGINFQASGIINDDSDKDVFKFNLSYPSNFRLNVVPENVGSGNAGANIDIKLSLLNQQADTIGQYNPKDLLDAGIDTNLNAGTYYFVVDGVGNINLSEYGSLGYYLLTGSIDNVLPVKRLTLSGAVNGDIHQLSWIYESDEAIEYIIIESSKDGVHFNELSRVSAGSKSFSWKPLDNGTMNYRLKVVTVAHEKTYYSNIIALHRSNGKGINIMSRVVTSFIAVNTDKNYTYQLLDESGRLLQYGKLVVGTNRIELMFVKKGLFLLHIVSENEAYTEKLIRQ